MSALKPVSISVVTRTRDRFAFLQDCVNSVQQTRTEPHADLIAWEHVIYDDGSTEPYDVGWLRSRPNTRYFRGARPGGLAVAANEAVGRARGEWVFVLDDDDVTCQRFLYNAFLAVNRHPAADWFVFDFFCADANLRYLVGRDYFGWEFGTPAELLEAMFDGSHYMQHNVLYRRSLWADCGRYDPALAAFDPMLAIAEDMDLYTRFVLRGHIPMYQPTISHIHRFHAGNMSAGVLGYDHQVCAARLRDRHVDRLPAGMPRS